MMSEISPSLSSRRKQPFLFIASISTASFVSIIQSVIVWINHQIVITVILHRIINSLYTIQMNCASVIHTVCPWIIHSAAAIVKVNEENYCHYKRQTDCSQCDVDGSQVCDFLGLGFRTLDYVKFTSSFDGVVSGPYFIHNQVFAIFTGFGV